MRDPLHETMFKIQGRLKDISSACLIGVDSWDKYNQLIGKARGLQEALDVIDAVLTEDEEDSGN
jgi:hypothetical protein